MNFKINEIPKFVINLNRRTDRLEEVKKEFDYMGWSFERFDAFDTSGYTGCGYSHKRIAEIVIERNYDYVMICEDDIFFMPYTKELLTILEEQLNNNEWDFFSLAPSLHRPVNKFNNELIDLTNLPPKDEKIHRGIYSAACYIITNKMAHVISKWNTNEVIQNQNLHIPIDMYFDLAIYPKYKSLTYKLPLVTQKPGFSNINNTNDSNHYLITYNWNVYSPEKISPKYFDYFISKKERDSQSKKVKFITSIYSDLFGTNFGGRPNRNSHYRWSLLSLLKMTNADFVCYTSDREYESLKTFFYKERNISEQKLKFIVFDLENHKFKELFEKYKDFDKAKKGDRCIEIQYMKYIWFMNEDLSYDYYFWIDAGLSHCGIIPNKYLKTEGNYYEKFYESNLFNNKFLKNLVENTKDKFTIIGKENVRNYWSGTVNSKHFTNYDRSIHVIGGLFGGKKELWKDMVELFEKYVYQVTQSDGRLYHEEDIMTLMFRNHPDKFINYYFETWWHENERVSGLNMDEHIKNNKSFYKIIEELNV